MRVITFLLFLLFSLHLPQTVFADDIYVVTSSKKLNVRSKPSKSGRVITQLNPGEEVRCISSNGSWMEIKLKNGRCGYASSEYLSYERPFTQEINNSSSNHVRKGGWWTTPTGMIIILILVSGILTWLFVEVFDFEGILAKIIVAFLGGSYLGGIVGLFSWWIFDNFWTPYLTVMFIWIGILLIKLASNYFSDSPSNNFDNNDWNTYGTGFSSSNFSSIINNHSYTQGYDDDDSDEEKERERKQEESNRYSREADDYYSKYEYYKRLAEEAESNAETEERYADDYEWRAKEFNDSSYASQASNCLSNASRYRYKARQYESEADRYYDLYREYKDKAW